MCNDPPFRMLPKPEETKSLLKSYTLGESERSLARRLTPERNNLPKAQAYIQTAVPHEPSGCGRQASETGAFGIAPRIPIAKSCNQAVDWQPFSKFVYILKPTFLNPAPSCSVGVHPFLEAVQS